MAGYQLSDVLDYIFAGIGLRHEAPFIWNLPGMWSVIGGRDQQRDMRPALLNAFGKIEAVHGSRHIDVCKEHPYIIGVGFQHGKGHIGIGSFQHMEAGILQIVSRSHPYQEFIFDKQNDWCVF